MNGAVTKRWLKRGELAESESQKKLSPSSPLRYAPTELQRYSVGVLSAVVALLLRAIVSPLYGNAYPHQTVWVAVAFSAWYCGLGPAILTVVVSALGVWYFFLPQNFSFHMEHPQVGDCWTNWVSNSFRIDHRYR